MKEVGGEEQEMGKGQHSPLPGLELTALGVPGLSCNGVEGQVAVTPNCCIMADPLLLLLALRKPS